MDVKQKAAAEERNAGKILELHDALYEQLIALKTKKGPEYRRIQAELKELRLEYNAATGREMFKV